MTLNKHHYSMPKEFIGKRVEIIYDADTLEIFYGLKLITTHNRDDTPYAYIQKASHNLPGRHGSYEKDLDEIFQRAASVDNILLVYLKEVAAEKKYPPLAFKICRGIMSLEKKYGLERLVAACACASQSRRYGYQEVLDILWSMVKMSTLCHPQRQSPKVLHNPPRLSTRTSVAVNTTQTNQTQRNQKMETNSKTAPVTMEKDRNAVSLDLMNRMKLHGMAAAFKESLPSTFAETMTPDTFLSWLLSREWDYRSAAAIERLIRGVLFRYKAFLEQIDYTISRGLERNQMERLASLDFVKQGQNLFITGSAGTGKSFIATALRYQACKEGIRTLYANASKLMGNLKVAKSKGTIDAELKKIERCPLLILDDLFLVPLDAKERPILLDIIEDRHGRKSIIVTSQLPVSSWYDAIGDPTVADAILDRIVHTAHQIELSGESR